MWTPSLEEAYLRRVVGPGLLAFTPGNPASAVFKPLLAPPVSLTLRLDPEELAGFSLGIPAPSANDLVLPFLSAAGSLAAGLKAAGRFFAWGRPSLWALLRSGMTPPSWVPLTPAELSRALEARRSTRLLAVRFSHRGEPVYLYLTEAFQSLPPRLA